MNGVIGVSILLMKKEDNKHIMSNNYYDAEVLTPATIKRMNRMDKNRRISHKKCSQWLKVIALEQAEQYAANLLNKGIDNDTVVQITGLTYGVVQLIANNCIA